MELFQWRQQSKRVGREITSEQCTVVILLSVTVRVEDCLTLAQKGLLTYTTEVIPNVMHQAGSTGAENSQLIIAKILIKWEPARMDTSRFTLASILSATDS
jgi:hypothetical protein